MRARDSLRGPQVLCETLRPLFLRAGDSKKEKKATSNYLWRKEREKERQREIQISESRVLGGSRGAEPPWPVPGGQPAARREAENESRDAGLSNNNPFRPQLFLAWPQTHFKVPSPGPRPDNPYRSGGPGGRRRALRTPNCERKTRAPCRALRKPTCERKTRTWDWRMSESNRRPRAC